MSSNTMSVFMRFEYNQQMETTNQTSTHNTNFEYVNSKNWLCFISFRFESELNFTFLKLLIDSIEKSKYSIFTPWNSRRQKILSNNKEKPNWSSKVDDGKQIFAWKITILSITLRFVFHSFSFFSECFVFFFYRIFFGEPPCSLFTFFQRRNNMEEKSCLHNSFFVMKFYARPVELWRMGVQLLYFIYDSSKVSEKSEFDVNKWSI